MRRVLGWIIGIIIALAVVFGLSQTVFKGGSSVSDATPETLRVGFVPSQQADKMENKAKPLGEMLSKELGMPVKVTVSTDYNSLVEALGSNKIDIGFLPPDGYVQAHKQYGADVLLQTQRFGINEDGTSTDQLVDQYKSEILVRADSGINSLDDLKGKKIAIQDVTSSAGFIFPTFFLDSKGIKATDYSTVTVKGHDQGVLAVENRQTDAAFVFQDARNIVKADVPSIFSDTKILALTDWIPNDTVTARKGLSQELKDKVKNALIKIAQTTDGKKLVENIYNIEGFAPSKDSNFDVVRDADKAVEK
jgi:phosphonate transport system substrate-binding protein